MILGTLSNLEPTCEKGWFAGNLGPFQPQNMCLNLCFTVIKSVT